MALTRIGAGLQLDGRPDEEAWRAVPLLEAVTYEPTYRAAPSAPTEIRIAYDDEHLYVSGRLAEPDASRVRGTSLYRDQWTGDDRFGVLVDPFNDNETALWFWTTPEGVRGDALVTGDGSGTNGDWNTHWDVATAVNDQGWSAELRIPLSSLGFQRSGDVVTMGVTVHRFLADRNERHVYPDISPDFLWRRPSLSQDVTLRGVTSGRPLYVTPFALAGRRRETSLPEGASAYEVGLGTPREVGVDIRFPVTHNLTLDLTANTDFAQVEVDDQQVNLTRFDLFFPEKRQFFLERAGIFQFTLGGRDRLFHSRRIGLSDQGPVRVLGGVRLAGRLREWDVGVLSLQTESSVGLPSENFGVLRARRRVFNDFSTAGGIVTTRIGDDGTYNVAYGLDAQLRLAGDDYLVLKGGQTFDDAAPGASALERTFFRILAYRARQQGWTYSVSARSAGAEFRPDLGFQDRQNFSELFYSIAWARIFDDDRSLRRIDPFQLFGNVVLRNADGSVESAFVEYDTDVTWKSGWGVWQDFELYFDDLREPLGFPESSLVPAGDYTYFRTEGGLNMPPGRRLRAGVNWGLQRFFDGSRWNVGVSPVWNVSPHLTLSARYQLDAVRFPDRDQGFDAHIARLRVRTAVDTRLSLSAFLQYSSVADLGGANVRLRYNFAEGTDLWLVYDEGLRLDRDGLDPRPPLSSRRTFLVKYSHTLRW